MAKSLTAMEKRERESSKLESFRLSYNARKLLADVALRNRITKTDVVEHSLARYALELGVEIGRARQLLMEHVAKGAAVAEAKGFADGKAAVEKAKPLRGLGRGR